MGKTNELPPIAELTPHQGTMLLLSRALEARPLGFTAEADIHADLIFADQRGVGAWTGIEYMAQTIAAWAGWQARQLGEPIKIGFLVGTRKFNTQRAWFKPGDTLVINVEQTYQADNGLGSFECTITIDGKAAADASLTVFQPQDVDAFLGDFAA